VAIHPDRATRQHEARSLLEVGDQRERDRRCAPHTERLGDPLEDRETLLRKRAQPVVEAATIEVHCGRA
jgi:hypothetical protein